MRLLTILLLVVTALVQVKAQAQLNLTAYWPIGTPECVSKCWEASISQSPCSPLNQTCWCIDPTMKQESAACLGNCLPIEQLVARNLTDLACHAEIRNRQDTFIRSCRIMGLICAVVVVIRFAAKIWVSKLWWDDWTILIAMLLAIPSGWMDAYATATGLGRDMWTLPVPYIYAFHFWFYLTEPFYYTLLTLGKLSILFFYLRIFTEPKVARVLWGTVAFAIIYWVIFTLLTVLQCQPIGFVWLKWDGLHEGQGHCLNINSIAWANAALSVTLDLWMLAIPLSQLNRLRLHWKKKLQGSIMFITGTGVTVISIIRLHSITTFANSTNPTWDNTEIMIWSLYELSVGALCACLPALRLLLANLFPRVFGSENRSQGHSKDSNSLSFVRRIRPRHPDHDSKLDLDTIVSVDRQSRLSIGGPLSPISFDPKTRVSKDITAPQRPARHDSFLNLTSSSSEDLIVTRANMV